MAIGTSKPLGNMIIGIDLDNSKFTSSMTAVQRSIRASATEMKAQMGVFTASGKTVDALKAKHDGLVKTLALQEKNMQYLKQRYDEVSNGGKNYNATVGRLQNQINKSVGEQARLRQELSNTDKAYLKATSSATIFRDKLVNTGSKLKDVGSTMTQAFGPASTAMGLGLGYAVKTAADFDEKMTKVGAISGASRDQFDMLRNSAIKLGQNTSLSASQVADAMTEMATKGYNANQIVKAMPGVINAAVASGEDLSLTATTVSDALNAFGMQASQATHVSDVMAMSANKSAAGVEDLSYTFKYAAAPAHSLGYSLESVAAATDIMANAGIRGETAGTSLRQAFLRLVNPPKSAANELKNLGVQITNSHGKMLPFATIIGRLNSATSNMSKAQRTAALATIFGTNAVSGMLPVVEAGEGKLNSLTKSLQNSNGASAKAAQQMRNNLKGAIDQLRGSVESGAIKIGEDLTPTIRDLTKQVQGAVDWFNHLSPATQQAIAKTALLGTASLTAATGLGIMLSAIGGGASAIGKLIGMAGAASRALRGMQTASEAGAAVGLASTASKAGMLAGALPLLANPIGLTVGALAALGIGAAVVYHRMNSLQDASTKTADAMMKSHDALQKEVNTFDDLRTRSLLTRAELGRYIDLQGQLNKATNPDKIKNLKNQMEQLRQKSGLSNTQLKKMAGLSVDLAKKVPGSTDAVTKEGKAYAYSTTQIKNYNKAKLGEAMSTYQQKYDAALSNEVKYHKEIADSQTAINKNKKAESYYQNIANEATRNGWAATLKKYDAQQWNMKATRAERTQAAAIVPLLKNHGELLYKNLADLYKQNNALSKTIAHDKSQLRLANSIYNKMVHITLEQAGVNDQKYKGIVAVDREINKQESVLSRLRSQHAQGKLNNYQYDRAIQKVQGQIDKLQGVRNKVISINGSAKVLNQTLSKDILKHIRFTGDTLTDARSINQALAKKVYKYVAVGVQMPAYKQVQLHGMMYGHATGAHNLPQAETALVGERGREFVHDPNVGTYLADGPSIVNLSRGSSVLKNADTERLGKALGLPGFAGGVGNYFDQLLGKTNDTIMMSLAQLPSAINGLTDVLSNLINNLVNKQLLSGNPPGKGVTRWTPQVIMALRMNGLSTSPEMVARVLKQIQTESGGDPHAMQHGYTDINSLKGDLAKGLMQTISATFNAYKFPGHGDIWNGFDNLLAALNYARHRYGPGLSALGHGHGYANGGWITSEQIATLGEGNKTEMVLPLTNQARSLQLMQQALAFMGSRQSGSIAAIPAMDTGRIESLLEQNNQLMKAFMKLVDKKPTGITSQQVYNANKQVSDQITRNRNLALGVINV